MQLLAVPAGTQLSLRNPYATEVITLLHIWLAAPDPVAAPRTEAFAYTFAGLAGQLAALVPGVLHLGCFGGRQEAVFRPQAGRLFAFVLAGAFELEGRLLHAYDGLALWECPAAELEALSPDALVLVLEF
ncbi:hypothetical protein I3A86_25800 [Salmonella enterica]|nr:hypothetical protein [Salmonella enterica]